MKSEVQFEVGDIVLEHLIKEIFHIGKCKKLKLKNIRPYKTLRIFSSNAYELEFPVDIGISPMYNVADLYPYRGDDT